MTSWNFKTLKQRWENGIYKRVYWFECHIVKSLLNEILDEEVGNLIEYNYQNMELACTSCGI